MDVKIIFYIILALILLLSVTFAVIWIIRKRNSRRKVCEMQMSQKVRLLNGLTEPSGFIYDTHWDVFTSRTDAWQRKFGYEMLFDRIAAGVNMVLDTWPVYFDYEGRTWLIEFWKGQYGINTGAETGIYHADGIVPPHLYKYAHFDAVADEEMPWIRCRLTRNGREVFALEKYHWWLTGFRMGTFSEPEELELAVAVRFRESEMASAFLEGLGRSGHPEDCYHISRNEVHIRMNFSEKVALLPRIHRRLVQIMNRFYCRLYIRATRPFTKTVDRMVFLYYLFPPVFRRVLGLKKHRYPRSVRRRRMERKK